MTAILGEHDVTVNEGVEKNCRISKTVQHPGYNGQTKHDMMLAQIKCNVRFSKIFGRNSLFLIKPRHKPSISFIDRKWKSLILPISISVHSIR